MKKITLLLFLAVGSFASAQSLDTLKLDTTNEQRLEDLKAKADAEKQQLEAQKEAEKVAKAQQKQAEKEQKLKEKQLKAINKWMKEHIEKTYISVNGEYKNCKFENNWLKK